MSETKATCMWCDREAAFLCDAVLGMKAAVGPKQTVIYAPLAEQEVWTCDAPMCEDHRRMVGFVCGKEPGTIDRCPLCVSDEPHCEPMLKEEAEAIRRARHALVRRSRLRATGS